MTKPKRDPRKRLSRPRVPGEMVDPVSVGDAAALVGAELGLAEPVVFTRLVDAWPQMVGETLAAHSHVRGVRNGVLEVVVDSPGWATELRYLERDLVERASEVVGAGFVVSVRAAVDGSSGAGPEPGRGGSR